VTGSAVVGAVEIEGAIRELDLVGRPVAVHVSLRSFGWLAQGPATIIDGLLAAGCTVLAATMAPDFPMAVRPHQGRTKGQVLQTASISE
jgi:hypothetical protein